MKKFLLSILCCLMAVFAVQAETVTYTVTSTSAVSVSGTAPSGSSATYESTYGTKCQLTGGNSMTLTLSGYAGYKITGITLSMRSNSSKGAGSYSMVVGETTISSIADAKFNNANWYGAWSTSYVDVTPAMTNSDYTIANGEDVVITIEASANSLYCQSFTIEYEAVGAVTPTAKKPTFSQESCDFNLGEPFAVTLSAEEDGATIYYTIDGNDPTEESDVYLSPIVISETTTVKAIAVVDGYNNSAVAEATYTAIDPNAPTATLSFASLDQRKSFSAEQQVWKQNGITFTNDKGDGSDVADYSNPVRLYKNSDITIETTREMSKIEFDCSTAGYATDLAASIDDVEVVGDKVTVTLSPAAKSYNISLTGGQVRLDAITVTYATQPQPSGFTVALTVGKFGYATLYLAAAAQIPDGVSAYIVTGTSNGYAKMKEVTGIIPANTGVILVAEQGEYQFALYDKGTADVTGNLLAGTLSHEYIDEEAYVLSAPDDVVGFYKAKMTDGTWLNNANKAYLPASAVANKAIAFYGFEWNGTTGIEGVEAEGAQDGAIYDLSGRRVKAITAPGIYIVNGKKVVVK
ncbi:MAG: chitobiase/beta-hexosaminidase C-terminal domain-containing protein [Bacteroidaceae bacterium]|nr:chitobiase/beta-hexosaminidase C-terminal domain-containing protein [Bacteroidaceae bacterium]